MAREYSPEVKAAVMAALMDGQSIRQVAKETGVSKSTVATWGKETQGVIDAVQDVPDTKRQQISGLVVELLIAKLEGQISMARHTADKSWQSKQDASAFAMVYGVADDKLIRLLEKLGDRADAGVAES